MNTAEAQDSLRSTGSKRGFLPALTVVLLLTATALAEDFYVSPAGRDTNPGTQSAPFATPGRAMEAVRGLAARGLKNDVRVTFDEGTYELSAPLIFTAADSGTPQYSVTYAAAPGKRVVISGGRAMKGWKQEGRKWTAELPSVKIGCPVEDIGGNGLVVG